jgi:hypothetical protein
VRLFYFFLVVGCGEAVGRFIPKLRQPKSNHSIRDVLNTDRATHRSARQPTSRSRSALVFFASLREPSHSQRTDSEVHVTLFPARSWYVPRSLGAGGVYEMTDVVDAIKVIAIVIGTAAHTLRCYCRGELLAVQARRAGTSKGRLN